MRPKTVPNGHMNSKQIAQNSINAPINKIKETEQHELLTHRGRDISTRAFREQGSDQGKGEVGGRIQGLQAGGAGADLRIALAPARRMA